MIHRERQSSPLLWKRSSRLRRKHRDQRILRGAIFLAESEECAKGVLGAGAVNSVDNPRPVVPAGSQAFLKFRRYGEDPFCPSDIAAPGFHGLARPRASCEILRFDGGLVATKVEVPSPVSERETVFAEIERPVFPSESQELLIGAIAEPGEFLEERKIRDLEKTLGSKSVGSLPHDEVFFDLRCAGSDVKALWNEWRARVNQVCGRARILHLPS